MRCKKCWSGLKEEHNKGFPVTTGYNPSAIPDLPLRICEIRESAKSDKVRLVSEVLKPPRNC
jgi:hypothetical protein